MAEVLTNQVIEARLKERFSDAVLHNYEPYGMLTLDIENSRIKEVIKFLKEDEEMGFTFLTTLCGMHYADDRLGVVYHLHNLPANILIRLKTYFSKENPETDTVSDVFASANWQERETYDFFGIIFKGHPDLRRILNMDEMDYFPLRREYPLEDQTRTDKDDSMFGRDGNYKVKL